MYSQHPISYTFKLIFVVRFFFIKRYIMEIYAKLGDGQILTYRIPKFYKADKLKEAYDDYEIFIKSAKQAREEMQREAIKQMFEK